MIYIAQKVCYINSTRVPTLSWRRDMQCTSFKEREISTVYMPCLVATQKPYVNSPWTRSIICWRPWRRRVTVGATRVRVGGAYSQSTIGQQTQTHKGKERKTTRPNCHPTITHKTLIPCTESKPPRKRMLNPKGPKASHSTPEWNYSGTPPPKRKKAK